MLSKKIILILIFPLFIFIQKVHSQWNGSYDINVLPFAFFAPETSWGFGGLVNGNFYLQDSIYRPSNILFGGAYTLEKQLLLYLPFEFNWKENKYIVKGEVGYFKYFFNYYGIGPEDDPEFEVYTVNFPRFQINAVNRFRGYNYLGVRYLFDDYNIQSLDPNGELQNSQVPGYQGSLVSTIGLVYAYDSRDYNFAATKGWFVSLFLDYNGPYSGSDFNYRRIILDAIKYISFKGERVLALNLYGGAVRGDIPFQELMLYGGTKKARGYYQGRLRDQNLLMFQGEYRFKIWRRFGGVIFGTLGNVGPTIGEVNLLRPKYNVGGGLRFMINPADRLNVRLDYAIGKETSGFYVTFGEAF